MWLVLCVGSVWYWFVVCFLVWLCWLLFRYFDVYLLVFGIVLGW